MKGFFITFEGTDGCGKSTQIRLLNEYLTGIGLKVRLTREPGGCEIAEKLREIILNAENKGISPLCELLLYEAARAQHVAEVIAPALKRGEIVICDRFIDSTMAYQGYARGFGTDLVEQLNQIAVQESIPDLTIFLKLPPAQAFARKGGLDTEDRIEQEGSEFFDKVYEGFIAIAAKEKDRIFCIDVQGTKAETHQIIRNKINSVLNI